MTKQNWNLSRSDHALFEDRIKWMLPLGGAVREVEVVPGVKGLVKAEWQACFFSVVVIINFKDLKSKSTNQGFHPCGNPARSPSL